jgi:hypothetical protein
MEDLTGALRLDGKLGGARLCAERVVKVLFVVDLERGSFFDMTAVHISKHRMHSETRYLWSVVYAAVGSHEQQLEGVGAKCPYMVPSPFGYRTSNIGFSQSRWQINVTERGMVLADEGDHGIMFSQLSKLLLL